MYVRQATQESHTVSAVTSPAVGVNLLSRCIKVQAALD